MAVQTAALNLAANGIGAGVTHLSLHSSDGSTTGANELAGGSYAREVPDYSDAAATGEDDLADPVTFGGPASPTNATHLGFWATSTWLGSVALAVTKTGFVDPDTLTVTSAPIVAAVPS